MTDTLIAAALDKVTSLRFPLMGSSDDQTLLHQAFPFDLHTISVGES
ncbi:MAG: hypothetical protein AAGA83_22285 [Cyanobacteria bacterium P01_F01_bin.116]